MNTTILFARHGSVDNPSQVVYRPDVKLSEDGVSQMRRLGKAFVEHGIAIDTIVTSPLIRAVTAAETIRDVLSNHPPIETADGFAPVSTPDWYGKPLSELDVAGSQDVWLHPEWCEETPQQVDERLKKAFDEIYARHEGKTVLVIGHEVELGMLQHRLENPTSEAKITLFAVPKGEALRMQVDNEGKATPLGIVKPAAIHVSKEIG